VDGMDNKEIKKFLVSVNERFSNNKGGRKSGGRKYIESTNFIKSLEDNTYNRDLSKIVETRNNIIE
jgi:hypothetical protein